MAENKGLKAELACLQQQNKILERCLAAANDKIASIQQVYDKREAAEEAQIR